MSAICPPACYLQTVQASRHHTSSNGLDTLGAKLYKVQFRDKLHAPMKASRLSPASPIHTVRGSLGRSARVRDI